MQTFKLTDSRWSQYDATNAECALRTLESGYADEGVPRADLRRYLPQLGQHRGAASGGEQRGEQAKDLAGARALVPFDVAVELVLEFVVANPPAVARQGKGGELNPVGVQAVWVAANALSD